MSATDLLFFSLEIVILVIENTPASFCSGRQASLTTIRDSFIQLQRVDLRGELSLALLITSETRFCRCMEAVLALLGKIACSTAPICIEDSISG